jgi:hypothetical protein
MMRVGWWVGVCVGGREGVLCCFRIGKTKEDVEKMMQKKAFFSF